MSFQDNSGDIILDVVLTDEGRRRLAKGDGSFKVAKFALGDDEINYEQFNPNHPSGSAYQDLEIQQTPIFEAFSDNQASMKSKLVSNPNSGLLYLPVVRLNEVFEPATARRTSGGSEGSFVVAVNKATEDMFKAENGIMLGENPQNGGIYIRVDQGLDTEEIAPSKNLDPSLLETQYSIKIDSKFGGVVSTDGSIQANPSFVDDDDIATYFFGLGTDNRFVKENTVRDTSEGQVISGPRGTYLQFKIFSSLELNANNALFNKFGSSGTITDKDGSTINIKYIDVSIDVEGTSTGFSVDIPARFIRYQP